MIQPRHLLNFIIFTLLPLLIFTFCSDPEAKVLFKYSSTKGEGETITSVTNAAGKVVLSYPMKTSFTSTYVYNKYNTRQIDGIRGEDYVIKKTGDKILVDTYFDLDVYEKPKNQKITSKEGKTLGYNGAVAVDANYGFSKQIYATEVFVTKLPVVIYSFNGDEIKVESKDRTTEYYKKDGNTLFRHSGKFNMIYTTDLDTLLALPQKLVKDSLSSRVVGFTAIKLDGIEGIFPFIRDYDTNEQTIYDRIPTSAKNDFDKLTMGEVKL